MAEIEVILETPLTMVEIKDKLEKVKKNHELGFRAVKAIEYLNTFSKRKAQEVEELKKKLKALDILRLKDSHISKIIDFNPKDEESVKLLLASENVTLKQEDVQKVVECLR